MDNLKVVLIAAIIAMHAILGYSTLEAWTYSWLREVTLDPVVEAVLILLVLPFGLILMALFFLVAGLLSVPSMQRKGPGPFARDRLVRLGVPFLGVRAAHPAGDGVRVGASARRGSGLVLGRVPR